MWQPSDKEITRHRQEGFQLISQALDLEEQEQQKQQQQQQQQHEGNHKSVELILALYKMGVHEIELALRLLDQLKEPGDKDFDFVGEDNARFKYRRQLVMGKDKATERINFLSHSSRTKQIDNHGKSQNENSRNDTLKTDRNILDESNNGKRDKRNGPNWKRKEEVGEIAAESWQNSLRSYSSRSPKRSPLTNSSQVPQRSPYPHQSASPSRNPARTGNNHRKVSKSEKPSNENTFEFPEESKQFSEEMISHLKGCIVVSKGVGFENVVGLEKAKQSLRESVILPSLRPEIFSGLRSPSQGLLLFGPPGNGKTLIAKALAKETSSVLFNVTASILTSKWVGEGEKLMRALFAMARRLAPSIIFIDEIDSILSTRRSSDHESSRRMKTEFFAAFDGVQSEKSDRILVIGATNRPEEIDDAAIRRFTGRIYISMPEMDTRIHLLTKLLSEHGDPLSDIEIRLVAKATKGYSSSDLANLARDAAFGPIRDIPTDLLISINPEKIRKIQLEDFRNALSRIRTSVSADTIQKFEEWNKKFGDVS